MACSFLLPNEEEKSLPFPLNVSEVLKLIQERITKRTYKYSYDETEEGLTDQDFYLRFNCIQGWFIRCSFKTKIDFLKRCAMQVNDLSILIIIINTLYTVSSKDRLYSLARGNVQAADMKLLADDNRCLHKATLKKVMSNEIFWFKTITNNKQYMFLMKLISLADGLVVMNNIFAHFIYVLNFRTRRATTSNIQYNSRNRLSSIFTNTNEERLREIIHFHFNKIIPGDISKSVSNNQLHVLLVKWKQFILKYTEQIYSPFTETINDAEDNEVSTKSRKKSTHDLDVIQNHPIWVTMSILNNLEQPQVMQKVNEYWSATVKDFKTEIHMRKLLNKDIATLENQLETRNYDMNLTRNPPELRDNVTNITKPSFRKKIKTKNVSTTHYSVISEVYKDYFVDFNLHSRKLQSFPRAMNLNKQKKCNLEK